MKSGERFLLCDCGFEARAEHEDELVTEVQRHAWETHAMTLTPDEARSLASGINSARAPQPVRHGGLDRLEQGGFQ